MLIKKKSLIVAFVSSAIIALVMILTLIGYITYLEINNKKLQASYEHSLGELRS